MEVNYEVREGLYIFDVGSVSGCRVCAYFGKI